MSTFSSDIGREEEDGAGWCGLVESSAASGGAKPARPPSTGGGGFDDMEDDIPFWP